MEHFERINREDAVPLHEKLAFIEMQQDAEPELSEIASDPLLREELEKGMERLTERQQKVIRQRFWEGKTREEIGKHFNVTREVIRTLEAEALRKLRNPRVTKRLE